MTLKNAIKKAGAGGTVTHNDWEYRVDVDGKTLYDMDGSRLMMSSYWAIDGNWGVG